MKVCNKGKFVICFSCWRWMKNASRCCFSNLTYCELFVVHWLLVFSCALCLSHTYTNRVCIEEKKFLFKKNKKQVRELLPFVWKRNEAEQNGGLNSEIERREMRAVDGEESSGRGRREVCVCRAGTLGLGPPWVGPQQEQEKSGGGLQTTQTTIDPDKSRIWNSSWFEKWRVGWRFGCPGMWCFGFWGHLSVKISQRLLQSLLVYSGGDVRSECPSSPQSK